MYRDLTANGKTSGQMNTSLDDVFDGGGVIGGGGLLIRVRVREPLVQPPVLRQVGAVGEPLVARRAGVRPLSRVQPESNLRIMEQHALLANLGTRLTSENSCQFLSSQGCE